MFFISLWLAFPMSGLPFYGRRPRRVPPRRHRPRPFRGRSHLPRAPFLFLLRSFISVLSMSIPSSQRLISTPASRFPRHPFSRHRPPLSLRRWLSLNPPAPQLNLRSCTPPPRPFSSSSSPTTSAPGPGSPSPGELRSRPRVLGFFRSRRDLSLRRTSSSSPGSPRTCSSTSDATQEWHHFTLRFITFSLMAALLISAPIQRSRAIRTLRASFSPCTPGRLHPHRRSRLQGSSHLDRPSRRAVAYLCSVIGLPRRASASPSLHDLTADYVSPD